MKRLEQFMKFGQFSLFAINVWKYAPPGNRT